MQSEIDKGTADLETALKESERLVAALGEKSVLVENLMKTQGDMERELEATRRAHVAAAAETEEVRRQLRQVGERQERAEEALAKEKEAAGRRQEEWMSAAMATAREGEDRHMLYEELKKERARAGAAEARSAELQQQYDELNEEVLGAHTALQAARAEAEGERLAAEEEGRKEAEARDLKLAEADKALWRARLEAERAQEEMEGLKASLRQAGR